MAAFRKTNEGKDMSLSFRQKTELTYRNGIRYIPLLKNLISRELKKKYRQSILGYAWSVLNPLLIMIIMTIVFSRMFRHNIENFPVFLFAGRMMYSFITDSAGSVMKSIVSNGQLMRKTRVPYYIFPLSALGSSMVNFFFQLIAFGLVLIFTGTFPSIHIVAFPLICLEMFLFSFGLGLILAVCDIYVRDTDYIYAVFTTAWMYLSVLFYPLSALPGAMQKLIVWFNPAYYFVDMSRSVFLYHQWPDGLMLLKGAVVGAVFTAAALAVYSRVKKDMILYV